jgi:hypothetical protein
MCKPQEMGCFQRADYTLFREGRKIGRREGKCKKQNNGRRKVAIDPQLENKGVEALRRRQAEARWHPEESIRGRWGGVV